VTPTPAPFLRRTLHGDDLAGDPAEEYHEASRLYPALAQRQAAGIARLAASEGLREISTTPLRVNAHLPSLALDLPAPEPSSLWEAIDRRSSAAPTAGPALRSETLALLLRAAYGTVGSGHRAVPSGGALYPLELFALTRRVEGISSAVWHLDPLAMRLERIGPPAAFESLVPAPELVEHAAALLFVAATFWRTRFKYGLRGYRFALLEAGHVAQNVALAAAASGVSALPLGGFYDALVDAELGLDGVDQSVLYGIVLGGEAE